MEGIFMMHATESKEVLARKVTALIDGGDNRTIAEICSDVGINVTTFYRWRNSPGFKRRARASVLPQVPATLRVQPLQPEAEAAGFTCPPGFVVVMVPVASIANVFREGLS